MSTLFEATALVVPFENLRMTDVEAVGGKNASLGEMISQLAASGVRVPGGFATTAHAFRQFLKHEGLDLAVLKRLFLAAGGDEIAALVRTSPTGGYARRIWFLYEWLLGDALDLPNATRGAYVPVVDPKLQWEARFVTSTRHRVKNNLPGTPEFCPLVFRTEELDRFVAMNVAPTRQARKSMPSKALAGPNCRAQARKSPAVSASTKG